MPNIGPIVLSVAGDNFKQSSRISAVRWVSQNSIIGDSVVLSCPVTGSLLWESVATWNHTADPQNFGPVGIHAPNGFILSQISSGKLLVYIQEH